MDSTLALFRRLYNNIPPLFPLELKEQMLKTITLFEQDKEVDLRTIEDAMIEYGYVVWPWNQAYKEFVFLAEVNVGEKFLLPKLPPEMRQKYDDFKKNGGTLRELHSGKVADVFTNDERVRLCVALVELQHDLRRYVEQELKGLSKDKYLTRVVEFERVLDQIKATLDQLRHIAHTEEDHPTLADEIHARVRGFEEGLCLLGPEIEHEEVCQSVDFFHGRKQDLNRLKGINVPLDIDWYDGQI